MLKRLIIGSSLLVALAAGIVALQQPVSRAEAAGPPGTAQFPCWQYPPVSYYFGQFVSGGWGYHVGEDVCHQEGTPVYAIADGIVKYSARTPNSYRWGNLIMIEHGSNTSLYGHLGDNRQVGAGAVVQKGQLIGYVGAQGDQNGNWEPHTHFGMHPGSYGAATGSYAPWAHGYESSFPHPNWVSPSQFVIDRRAAYDFVSQEESFGRVMYNNDGVDVTIRLRNSGHATWRAGGSNPMRLGTSNPRDRGSGFSDNGNATGWTAPNRVALQADTPPDELGTFTFRLKSPGVAGNYTECFEPIAEGITWLGDRRICLPVTVLPPGYRGQAFKQEVSTVSSPTDRSNNATAENLRPGDKRNYKLYLKNVGELNWDVGGANPVRLGGSNPQNRGSGFATVGDGSIPASENWLSANRASNIDGRFDPTLNQIVPDTQITNGEIAVFSFTITTPDAPGNRPEYFNGVVEGIGWMPDFGIFFPASIADRGYHYQYVSQTLSDNQLGQGENTVDYTVRLKNTGRETWPVNGTLRLGTDRPLGHDSSVYTPSGTGAWLSPNRPSTAQSNVTVPGKTTVETGETAQFGMRLTVPTNFPTGAQRLFVRPVMDGVAWLPEDYGINVPFTVSARGLDYQVQKQVFTNGTTIPHGGTTTARLAVKNTGRTSWATSGANAIKLAPTRPQDRGSAFATFTGSDPWPSATRASLIEGRVTNLNTLAVTADSSIDPGETALFDVPLTGNPNAGTYPEYFNLLAEGIAWMPDYGIYFPITIQGGGGVPPGTTTTDSPANTRTVPTATPLTSPTPR